MGALILDDVRKLANGPSTEGVALRLQAGGRVPDSGLFKRGSSISEGVA